MAIEKQTNWIIDHSFDTKTCRHSMNGFTSVLHCHHYATLYCQLADDAELLDGKALLIKSCELTFFDVLSKYFKENNVNCKEERVTLAEEYWKLAGMGLLKFDRYGSVSASAHMDHSHVDEGWIKKWGKRDKPVNFFGQGYIAAALAAIYDLPIGSFTVTEQASIVSGAEASVFNAVRV